MRRLQEPVRASQLAAQLGLKLVGEDTILTGVGPLGDADSGCLTFSKTVIKVPVANVAVVAPPGSVGIALCSDNPRFDFTRALRFLYAEPGFIQYTTNPEIDSSAVIGQGCIIGAGVRIGARARIGDYVVLEPGVQIGAGSTIKAHVVVGHEGFGFERNHEGVPLRIPHLGTVVIGDDVEIGSFTSIARGTLANTVIESGSKIDDHVHIAHNVRIGRNVVIVSGVHVSGSVSIGEGAWIAPSAAIVQGATIGAHATVGIGATVLGPIEEFATAVGTPARTTKVRPGRPTNGA